MAATVLVTGASGYIGKQLVAALCAKGDTVHALMRPGSVPPTPCSGLHLHTIDENYESIANVFAQHDIHAVLHLATRFQGTHTPQDIAPLLQSNITFGAHLLEAASQHGCPHFINTGTYWEYDAHGHYSPNSLYAASKRAFVDVLEYYTAQRSLSALTLTLYDVYGKGDTRGKIFNLLDKAAADNTPLPMTAGGQQLCLTHVEDAVNAFLVALEQVALPEHKHRHTVYFAGAAPVALKEIVECYLRVTGKQPALLWGQMPYRAGQIMTPYRGSPLPGWTSQVSLEDGIRKSFT